MRGPPTRSEHSTRARTWSTSTTAGPASPSYAASGQQPGVAVIHAGSRRTLAVIEPPRVESVDGVQLNDLHGIGVRPVSGGDGPVRGRSAHALVRRPQVAPVQVRGSELSFGCHLAG